MRPVGVIGLAVYTEWRVDADRRSYIKKVGRVLVEGSQFVDASTQAAEVTQTTSRGEDRGIMFFTPNCNSCARCAYAALRRASMMRMVSALVVFVWSAAAAAVAALVQGNGTKAVYKTLSWE